MFPKLKILAVDDRQYPALDALLQKRLGPRGTYADWDAMDSATKAIQRFETGWIPDFTVIDMNFSTGSGEVAEYVGKDPDSRGFMVATALEHYALRCRATTARYDYLPHRPRYVLFTAQPKVVERYEAFCEELPRKLQGADPLLRIVPKSRIETEADDATVMLDIIRREILCAAQAQVRARGVRPALVGSFLDTLAPLEAQWERMNEEGAKAFQGLQDDIQSMCKWWEEQGEEIKSRDRLIFPYHQVRSATWVADLCAALDKAQGESVKQRMAPLRAKAEALSRLTSQAMFQMRDAIYQAGQRIAQSEAFQVLCFLFPFAAQQIRPDNGDETVDDPATLIGALRDILSVLDRYDHHHSLFRMLKSIGGEEVGKRVFLTRFADATHNLRLWIERGEQLPQNGELLREVQVLPSATIDRMIDDASRFREKVAPFVRVRTKPYCSIPEDSLLLWFALLYSEAGPHAKEFQMNWHNKWSESLRALFGSVVLNGKEEEFLSDWRHFFDHNDGLFVKLSQEPGLAGKHCSANITYTQAGTVSLSLEWSDILTDFKLISSLERPLRDAGGLGGLIYAFAEWGQVEVQVKVQSNDGRTKVRILRYRPYEDDWDDDDGAPWRLRLKIEAVDYLNRRSVRSEGAIA